MYIAFGLLALVLLVYILRAEGDESIGFGGTLLIDDGAADAFVAVPKLETLGVPSEMTGVVESKTLDLPAATVRKIATLKNGGSFTFKYQLIAATHARIEVIRAARTKKNFRITVPIDTGTLSVTVPGYITANPIEDLEAEKITVGSATVEVAGAPTTPFAVA